MKRNRMTLLRQIMTRQITCVAGIHDNDQYSSIFQSPKSYILSLPISVITWPTCESNPESDQHLFRGENKNEPWASVLRINILHILLLWTFRMATVCFQIVTVDKNPIFTSKCASWNEHSFTPKQWSVKKVIILWGLLPPSPSTVPPVNSGSLVLDQGAWYSATEEQETCCTACAAMAVTGMVQVAKRECREEEYKENEG